MVDLFWSWHLGLAKVDLWEMEEDVALAFERVHAAYLAQVDLNRPRSPGE